eukprot:1753448-Amphidinium_carterae.1
MADVGVNHVDMHAILGRSELVIQIANTRVINTDTMQSLFLVHSIVMWSEGTMGAQWHMNYYTGLALASTPSMAGALRTWMQNNGLGELLLEFFTADNEPRFPFTDTGIESNSTYAYYLKSACASKWSITETDGVKRRRRVQRRFAQQASQSGLGHHHESLKCRVQ